MKEFCGLGHRLFQALDDMNISSIAIGLAIITIVLAPVTTAFGEMNAAETPKQLFGCQYYGDTMHCNVLLNDLQGYEATANSTLVHPVTNDQIRYVDGKIGGALEMHSEYRESIEMMNVPEFNTNQFTISFWVKSVAVEPYGDIVSHSNKLQTAGWLFDSFSSTDANGNPTSKMRFGLFNSNGTLFAPSDIIMPSDRFMHIVGAFDGSKVTVYQDGNLLGERQFNGSYVADPGVPLRIGSAAYCASCNRWSGSIDDLRVYNRSLNDTEVKQLFDMSYDVSSGIVGYWKLDANTNDELGNNNGTSSTMVTSMKFAPDGRLFFDEKNTGEVRIMTPDQKILDQPFASIDDVYVSWEQGLLGLTLDPDFEQNHYVYLYYSALINGHDASGSKVINRVIRLTEKNNIGTDTKVLLDNIPASRGYHSGGALAFGHDDKLYVTVGDATEHIFAQDPSIAIGKVLRINRDGTIPEDNPYPNSPVYTTGHRNMYGIAFDKDGTGLITENGDYHFDEINEIQKGGNYGFPTLQPPNLPPERTNNSSIKPLRTYWDTIAPTQMIYYDGNAIPELKGTYLYGSFTGDIYAVRLSEDKKAIEEETKIDLKLFPFVPVISIAESPDGSIYYGGYQIYRLDSLSAKHQNLYEVKVNAPSPIVVTDLMVQPNEKKIQLESIVNANIETNSTFTVEIPRALANNLTKVIIEGAPKASISNANLNTTDPNYTVVSMDVGPLAANSVLKFAFTGDVGTAVVPEFPGPILAATSVFVIAVTATIVGKRKGLL